MSNTSCGVPYSIFDCEDFCFALFHVSERTINPNL
jgi:hypothetical protein